MPDPINYILTTRRKTFHFFPIHHDQTHLREMIAQFDLDDIVTALCRIRRFGGHGENPPLTVAQHSLLVGEIVKKCLPLDAPYTLANYTPREARIIHLQALTHDFSEAYLGDIPRPLKHNPMMQEFRKYDEALQYAIYQWLGMREPECSDTSILNMADAAALVVEAENGFGLANLPEGWDIGLKKLADGVPLTRVELQDQYLLAAHTFEFKHRLKTWVKQLIEELKEYSGFSTVSRYLYRYPLKLTNGGNY